MMDCVKMFLTHGLKDADPINLKSNKLTQTTPKEFVNYIENNLILDKWTCKRKFLKEYNDNCVTELTSNALTRFLKKYTDQKDLNYLDKNAGGKLSFILVSPEKERLYRNIYK